MKYLLIFLFPILVKAQTSTEGKIITIHPAVSKTITVDDKKQYHLFPEYKDSLFESAEIVKYNDTTYTITFKTTTGKTIEKAISTDELDKIHHQINDISSESAIKKEKKASKNKNRWSGIIFIQTLLFILEILIILSV